MAIYVKLGKKADSFSDPITGFNISGNQVSVLSDSDGKSGKIKSALLGGHLVRASQTDYKAWAKHIEQTSVKAEMPKTDKDSQKEILSLKEQLAKANQKIIALTQELDSLKAGDDTDLDLDEKVDFSAMTDEELVGFYEENYQVTKAQLKAFDKLTTEQKVEELEKLDTEN